MLMRVKFCTMSERSPAMSSNPFRRKESQVLGLDSGFIASSQSLANAVARSEAGEFFSSEHPTLIVS